MADGIDDRVAAARQGLRTCDPNDGHAAFNAGVNALNAGIAGEALALLDAATHAAPGDARLWQVLGLIHRALDDLAPAVAALGKAAALASGDALIAHGLARASVEAGLPAIPLFERAHSLAPTDGAILLGHAASLFAEGRLPEAVAAIEAQLRVHPGWLPGHALLARLYWLSGERAAFTAGIERAIATAPRDISLWRELIVTLMHADRYEETLEAIARGRAAAGPHVVFDANEAACRAELGETAEADRLFAALPPLDDVTVRIRQLRHLLRSGRAAEAARMAEPLTTGANAELVWPYLSVAWRLLDDPRWEWLEGDPRLVGVFDLADEVPLAALAERLRALHVAPGQPLEQSVRGGTQTDGPLFARIEPEIRALRRAIVAAVERYVARLPPVDPTHPLLRHRRGDPVRFSGSWSVRLQAQGHHANHIHPAGWFSSAFYVALPSPEQRGPEPAGWLALGEPQAELGVALPPMRVVEPRPGRLVLFPSTMWHGTLPFEAGERLTVAFDVARPR